MRRATGEVCTEGPQQVKERMEDKQGMSTHEVSRDCCEASLERTGCLIWLKNLAAPGDSPHTARHTWSFYQYYLSVRECHHEH